MKSPVSAVVSTTPRVDRTSPGASTGLISLNLVSIPPVNRMIHRDTMPINWAWPALLNCSPSPSVPKSMPATRKSRREGRPKRKPTLLMRIPQNTSTDIRRSMFSEVNVMSVLFIVLSLVLPAALSRSPLSRTPCTILVSRIRRNAASLPYIHTARAV